MIRADRENRIVDDSNFLETRLSPCQAVDRDEFHKSGFVVLPQILSSLEVERFRLLTLSLFERRCGWSNGDYIDMTSPFGTSSAQLLQIMYPSKYDQELASHPLYDRAREIAQHILGDEVYLDFDHAILKPALHGTITPWHQDEAYWDPEYDHNSVSIWLALQETNAENGCMHFIPGSHSQGVFPHSQYGGNADVHALEAQDVDITNAWACPVPAGSGTAHHQRLLHFTGPNLSDMPRLAYVLVFCRPPVLAKTPRVHSWRDALLDVRRRREQSKDS